MSALAPDELVWRMRGQSLASLDGEADRAGGMDCVYCGSGSVTERSEVTAHGYRRFRCRDCRRQFNERSGGLLNRTGLPSDVGRSCYLYRAIDRDGNLVDTMLSASPDRVTTDGHGSYPRAIRSILGKRVRHRTSAYLNNRLEQDHRGIKGRIRCMRGFQSHDAAARFCREHGELRDLLRSRRHHNQTISASSRRSRFSKGARIALNIMQNA
jgi:transposase-like protein